MKKHNLDPAYGEGPARTGLVLALVNHETRERIEWPTFGPLAEDDVIWPKGYAPHHGVHQMDVVVGAVPNNQRAA